MDRGWDWMARHATLLLVVAGAAGLTWALLTGAVTQSWWGLSVLLWLLTTLGLWDRLQPQHTLMRNYPVIAHFRWLAEWLRPFLRQYIVESDLSGRPFNREQRSLIYRRAKNSVDAQPFGSDLDMYADEFELLTHSMAPRPVPDHDFRVTVGSSQCTRPYAASILNISAMSFGALGGRAIEALNLGANQGRFYQDTGEGGISPYHTRHQGDLVWEIGSGYFGCRDGKGRFDPVRFAEQASREQVRMIEIKLSQGAKPGHGGVLPGSKVTPEIAHSRMIPVAQECISPAYHTAFSTPRELCEFAASLRDASGGKPVGIKLCVGHPWEVLALCKAMLETGIRLDFMVVDGAEGGTGAAPEEFSDHVGAPLREGLLFVRNALVATGLRNDIRIAASGKVSSAFSIAANLAIGADWCNAARAFMLALGCVMSKNCHTNNCPTGVATQDPHRQRGLVIPEKAARVVHFHHNTLKRLAELVAAAGLEHPGDFHPHHLFLRTSTVDLVTLDRVYEFLAPDSLLLDPDSTSYAEWWRAADPDSFAPCRLIGPSHHKSRASSMVR